jgi:hypothetical protein
MFSVSNPLHRAARLLLLAGTALLAQPAVAKEVTPAGLDATEAIRIATAFGDSQNLQAIDDEALGDIQAQAGSLILMDKIAANESLTGKPTDGSANFAY